MAFDVFLDLNGIRGESRDKVHAGEIDVLSYSWLVGPAATATGKAQLTALVVNKALDTASPQLFDRACSGATIATGRLTVRTVSAMPIEILRLNMNGIKVIRLTPQWNGSVEPPMESVQLQFTSAEIQITEQAPDGRPGQTFLATCG